MAVRNAFVFMAICVMAVFIAGCTLTESPEPVQSSDVIQTGPQDITKGAGCDSYSWYANVAAYCSSGTITVSAYLNGVLVNVVKLTKGQSYCFIRSNANQKLTLKLCWPASGGYYSLYYC